MKNEEIIYEIRSAMCTILIFCHIMCAWILMSISPINWFGVMVMGIFVVFFFIIQYKNKKGV